MRKKTTTEWLNVIGIMNPAKVGFLFFENYADKARGIDG